MSPRLHRRKGSKSGEDLPSAASALTSSMETILTSVATGSGHVVYTSGQKSHEVNSRRQSSRLKQTLPRHSILSACLAVRFAEQHATFTCQTPPTCSSGQLGGFGACE